MPRKHEDTRYEEVIEIQKPLIPFHIVKQRLDAKYAAEAAAKAAAEEAARIEEASKAAEKPVEVTEPVMQRVKIEEAEEAPESQESSQNSSNNVQEQNAEVHTFPVQFRYRKRDKSSDSEHGQNRQNHRHHQERRDVSRRRHQDSEDSRRYSDDRRRHRQESSHRQVQNRRRSPSRSFRRPQNHQNPNRFHGNLQNSQNSDHRQNQNPQNSEYRRQHQNPRQERYGIEGNPIQFDTFRDACPSTSTSYSTYNSNFYYDDEFKFDVHQNRIQKLMTSSTDELLMAGYSQFDAMKLEQCQQEIEEVKKKIEHIDRNRTVAQEVVTPPTPGASFLAHVFPNLLNLLQTAQARNSESQSAPRHPQDSGFQNVGHPQEPRHQIYQDSGTQRLQNQNFGHQLYQDSDFERIQNSDDLRRQSRDSESQNRFLTDSGAQRIQSHNSGQQLYHDSDFERRQSRMSESRGSGSQSLQNQYSENFHHRSESKHHQDSNCRNRFATNSGPQRLQNQNFERRQDSDDRRRQSRDSESQRHRRQSRESTPESRIRQRDSSSSFFQPRQARNSESRESRIQKRFGRQDSDARHRQSGHSESQRHRRQSRESTPESRSRQRDSSSSRSSVSRSTRTSESSDEIQIVYESATTKKRRLPAEQNQAKKSKSHHRPGPFFNANPQQFAEQYDKGVADHQEKLRNETSRRAFHAISKLGEEHFHDYLRRLKNLTHCKLRVSSELQHSCYYNVEIYDPESPEDVKKAGEILDQFSFELIEIKKNREIREGENQSPEKFIYNIPEGIREHLMSSRYKERRDWIKRSNGLMSIVDLEQSAPRSHHLSLPILLEGLFDPLRHAKKAFDKLVEEIQSILESPTIDIQISDDVGKVLLENDGKGIKRIQKKSRTWITLESEESENGRSFKTSIQGTDENVEIALLLLSRELRVEMYTIPEKFCSRFIGTNGANISKLRSDSGASFVLSDEAVNGYRSLEIRGRELQMRIANKKTIACLTRFEEEDYQEAERNLST